MTAETPTPPRAVWTTLSTAQLWFLAWAVVVLLAGGGSGSKDV